MPKDFESDDLEPVKLFLTQYKNAEGNTYDLTARPDTDERKEKAIEAIAEDKHGRRLAIEHTLVQPFEGKIADDVPFTTVFERLRKDESLRLPNRFIDVLAPAFAIPKGVKWGRMSERKCTGGSKMLDKAFLGMVSPSTRSRI